MPFLVICSLLLSLVQAESALFRRQERFPNATSEETLDAWLAKGNASFTHDIRLTNITLESPSATDLIDSKAYVRLYASEEEGEATVVAGVYPSDAVLTDRNNTDWLTCISLTRFRNHNVALDEPLTPDCSNAFSEDCIEYIGELVQGGKFCWNETTWKDSPCQEFLKSENEEPSASVGVSQTASNGADAVGIFVDALRSDGSEEEEGEEYTGYDDVINNVFLLGIGYGRKGSGMGGFTNTVDGDRDGARSRFVCLRPDTFAEGSRTREDIEDAGDALRARLGWITVLVAVAVALLL